MLKNLATKNTRPVWFYWWIVLNILLCYTTDLGFPWWLSGKESACQCRRHKRCRFDPWVRNIPWKRKWQPSPLFLPGKSHGQRSLVVYSLWCGKRVRYDLATKQQQYWFYSNIPEKKTGFIQIFQQIENYTSLYMVVYTDICPESKTWKIHIIGKDNYRLISLLNIDAKILMIC